MIWSPQSYFVSRSLAATVAVALSVACADSRAVDPWADRVVSYVPGAGIEQDFLTEEPYDNPQTALGEPTRVTSPDAFGGGVTPLQAPFRASEVVSVGRGGSLVVAFDEPVLDDPRNPFGIDFLIFGNAFVAGDFFRPDFTFDPAGLATGLTDEGGQVEVSADGVNFVPLIGSADGQFPTNAFADASEPFPAGAGTAPADFTLPVNPSFTVIGHTFAEIVAAYAGSGGGAGFDIGAAGLPSVSYVRITNSLGANHVPEIDAIADVRATPEPAGGVISAIACIFLGKSARRSMVDEGRGAARDGELKFTADKTFPAGSQTASHSR